MDGLPGAVRAAVSALAALHDPSEPVVPNLYRHLALWPEVLPPLREALLAAAREAGLEVRDGGTYGHVDGPRFNTKAEIRGLAACGVTAVSQTAGPETVLAGELELPFALLGYVTDYANGVADVATPVATLLEMMGRSTDVLASVLAAALPRIDAAALAPTGMVYRFEQG